jgi:centromeric protein E
MIGTDKEPGIIPLAVREIFRGIEDKPHSRFLLRVSYLEIYNEHIHDLLSPGHGDIQLQVGG